MKRQRKRVIPSGILTVEVAEDPLDVILAKEQRKALARYISLLPMRQKQVMCMFYLWGWRQARIAKKLGIPRQNVLKHRKAAVKNLRQFFGAECDKQPQTTLIGESIFSREVGAALEEAAVTAESDGGEGGFHFIDEVYRAPHRNFMTPYTIAYDKQRYLDGCFHDKVTRIPRGI
jgi:hypothetical protein